MAATLANSGLCPITGVKVMATYIHARTAPPAGGEILTVGNRWQGWKPGNLEVEVQYQHLIGCVPYAYVFLLGVE